MKRHKILALVAAAALVGFGAATVQTNFTSLQVGAPDYSPDLAVGDGDIYAEGTLEVDGIIRGDSDVDFAAHGAIAFNSATQLADAGKAAVDEEEDLPHGLYTVIDITNETRCSFILQGAGDTAVEVEDDGTDCTVTEDNDATVNVYYDSANDRYEVNNETGAAADLLIYGFKQ